MSRANHFPLQGSEREQPMPATSGPTSPRPFASYDQDTSCWRTSGPTSPSGSMPYSGRWPNSGTTRSGHAYELPTPAPPTDVNDYSWLPTPTASEATGAGHAAQGGRNLRTEVTLLPTPEASDSSGGRVSAEMGGTRPSGAKRAVTLATAVQHRLLPTPTARLGDARGTSHPDRRKELQPKRSGELDEVAVHVLLPTPTARDHKGTSPNLKRDGAPNLDTAMLLLPTPVANEWKGASQPPGRMRNGKPRPLSDCRVSDLVTRGLIGEPTSPPSDDGNAPSDETPPTPPSPANEKEPGDVSPPLSSNGLWVYPRATSRRSPA